MVAVLKKVVLQNEAAALAGAVREIQRLDALETLELVGVVAAAGEDDAVRSRWRPSILSAARHVTRQHEDEPVVAAAALQRVIAAAGEDGQFPACPERPERSTVSLPLPPLTVVSPPATSGVREERHAVPGIGQPGEFRPTRRQKGAGRERSGGQQLQRIRAVRRRQPLSRPLSVLGVEREGVVPRCRPRAC